MIYLNKKPLVERIKLYQTAHLINKRNGFSELNCSTQASEKRFAQGFRSQQDPVNDLVNDLDFPVEI